MLNSNEQKQVKYYFNSIEECNMCGSPVKSHKVLGRRLNQSQGKNPKKKIGISTTICKCDSCDLVYSNPQPIPFDIHDHYGVPPEAYWNANYFIVNPNYFQEQLRKGKELIDFKEGMKSLDIGAGIGKQMVATMNAGFDSYGFEASRPFYDRAISKMGIHPEKLSLGMIEDMNFPENHFDFISFGAVLEHLYNPSESISKAMNWVKPEGIVHIEVPSSDWLITRFINLFYKLKRTDYVSNLSPMHEPYHLHEFSLESFKKNGLLNHYSVVHHEYYVCKTYMPKIFDLILNPYMRWTNKGMQLTVWLRKKESF